MGLLDELGKGAELAGKLDKLVFLLVTLVRHQKSLDEALRIKLKLPAPPELPEEFEAIASTVVIPKDMKE